MQNAPMTKIMGNLISKGQASRLLTARIVTPSGIIGSNETPTARTAALVANITIHVRRREGRRFFCLGPRLSALGYGLPIIYNETPYLLLPGEIDYCLLFPRQRIKFHACKSCGFNIAVAALRTGTQQITPILLPFFSPLLPSPNSPHPPPSQAHPPPRFACHTLPPYGSGSPFPRSLATDHYPPFRDQQA